MTITLNRVRLLGAAALLASLAVAPAGAAAEPEGAGPGRKAQQTDQGLAPYTGKAAQQGQQGGRSGQSAATAAAGKGAQQAQATKQGHSGQRAEQQGTTKQAQNGQRAQQGSVATQQDAQRQGTARTGSAQGTSAPQDEGRAENTTGMNARFATPLTNRCVYSASIRGVVAPSETWDRSDAQRNLRPNLHIEAELACPNQPPVTVKSNIAPEGAITRAELETELERRATLTARDNGGRCAYAPDFIMTDDFFASRGVTYMCSLEWPIKNK